VTLELLFFALFTLGFFYPLVVIEVESKRAANERAHEEWKNKTEKEHTHHAQQNQHPSHLPDA
jgi:hypothetical protein